ncbi:mechanosensitive ion channel [Candidatus Micrarchaeota archaeon]|nr:mechanosensitive ion channel [Candidatus Micrarchaeota archaeon]
MEIIGLNSAVYGIVSAVVAFVFFSVVWSLAIRLSERLFSKSKFYFIPSILKEISQSVFVVIILLSAYIGFYVFDKNLLEGVFLKIWGLILIVAVADTLAKIFLTFMDTYYRKSLKKSSSFFYKAMPLMKGIVGFFLYAVAFILILNYISYEIGSVVTLIGVIILVMIFWVFRTYLENMFAGFQIAGHNLREGDYISMEGAEGFVEKIMSQSTVLKTAEGRSITIPNSRLIRDIIKNDYYSEGNLMVFSLSVKSKDVSKDLKRIDSLSGKFALELDTVANDYKPKVYLNSFSKGTAEYKIKFLMLPNSDILRITDLFGTIMHGEFKDRLESFRLG